LKTAEVDQPFGAIISTVPTSYLVILAKHGLGCILVDFFSNSFGHPALIFLRREFNLDDGAISGSPIHPPKVGFSNLCVLGDYVRKKSGTDVMIF
jgi:hypothetical protein